MSLCKLYPFLCAALTPCWQSIHNQITLSLLYLTLSIASLLSHDWEAWNTISRQTTNSMGHIGPEHNTPTQGSHNRGFFHSINGFRQLTKGCLHPGCTEEQIQPFWIICLIQGDSMHECVAPTNIVIFTPAPVPHSQLSLACLGQ